MKVSVKCAHCGKDQPKNCSKCPECGRLPQKESKFRTFKGMAKLLYYALVVLFALFLILAITT